MSLIVEDGTGKPDAESYISVADADTYHARRNNTEWAALSDPEKEAALIAATDYMQGYYSGSWKGYKLTQHQALDWPRYAAVVDGFTLDSAIIPQRVKNAASELAFRSSQEPLAPDLEPQVKDEQVGPIKVTYKDGGREVTKFRSVDNALDCLLQYSGNTFGISRA